LGCLIEKIFDEKVIVVTKEIKNSPITLLPTGNQSKDKDNKNDGDIM
jgi:azurin